PLGKAYLPAVLERLVADARRLIGLGIDVGDVRDVDRGLFLDDAAGIARRRARVPFHHVDAIDHDTVLRPEDLLHLAGLTLVAAGDDHDLVALLDLELRHGSEHLRRKGDDLHELARTQLASDRAEDAGADRLALLADQHGGIAVEADRRAVGPADLLRGAHDHGLMHVALLDAAARDRVLHGHHDYVADGRVFALGAAQHLDALDAPSAGIVGDIEIGLHLDHRRVIPLPWPRRPRPCGRGAA